jgi:hypothetical protein
VGLGRTFKWGDKFAEMGHQFGYQPDEIEGLKDELIRLALTAKPTTKMYERAQALVEAIA